jgi:hypothetical protein
MVWPDQDPPATDVLLNVTVPFSGGGTPAYLEIDNLPEGLTGQLWERCLTTRSSAGQATLGVCFGTLAL